MVDAYNGGLWLELQPPVETDEKIKLKSNDGIFLNIYAYKCHEELLIINRDAL